MRAASPLRAVPPLLSAGIRNRRGAPVFIHRTGAPLQLTDRPSDRGVATPERLAVVLIHPTNVASAPAWGPYTAQRSDLHEC